jgi:general secretion pathway protein B
MSYILEALKKAQAERQLGSAPTIHAPPLVRSAPATAHASRKPLLIGLAAGALVVAVAAVVAWRQQGGAPASAPVVVAASVPAAPAPAAAPPTALPVVPEPAPLPAPAAIPAPASQPMPAAIPRSAARPAPATIPAPASEPAPAAVPESASRPAPAPAARTAVAKPVPRRLPESPVGPADASLHAGPVSAERGAATTAVTTARAPSPAEAPAAPATQQSEAEPAVYAGVRGLQSLPEVIQREVPKVAFGGYIYSQNPADRLLLVNKTLRREGEEVAPGLVLERLLPKAAVMNYRGYRYRVPY